MPSFFIPLSGLNADSTALNTIANNLTNMNTTAYKAQTTNFADLFYQQVGSSGSGDPILVGSGVQVASNQTDFTQGTFNTNGMTSSDVAINGNGFFVINDGGTEVLTRNGAFQQATNGDLETADGLQVLGYPATDGVVNTNAALSPINIPVTGDVMAPQATSNFGMTAILNSQAQSDSSSSVQGQVKVYDSLGNSYEATVTYTKAANNQWNYSVSLPDTITPTTNSAAGTTTYDFGSSGATPATVDAGTDLTITGLTTGGTSATITAPTITAGESITDYVTDLNTALGAAGLSGSVSVTSNASNQLVITGTNYSVAGNVVQDPVASSAASGTLTFDSSGNLVSPSTNITGITFTGLSDGAAPLNMTWDVLGSSGTPTITQTATDSSTSSPTADGYASGSYKSFTIGADGTISASYSNGETQVVGQLALADVANLDGLAQQGDGNYATTQASGAASIGVSGTNGLGTLQDSSLEQSNVNISSEFSNLIVAQRAFEANAKSVTTFDTVTQDTINMIH